MPAASNIPFGDALRFARDRRLLPTDMSAAEIEQLAVEVRQGAVFSAGVMETEVLQLIKDRTETMASGLSQAPGQLHNRASVRTELKELLDAIGYQPEPGREGTISDLRTDARLNLIIDTQLKMAHGYGQWRLSQSEGALLIFPCQEFKRISPRRVPRGYKIRAGAIVPENPRYWQDRWVRAGGTLYQGRMIARVNDPVWTALSRFGLPYDPVDFNTGFGRVNVGRAEAVRLGVIQPREMIAAAQDSLATPAQQAAALDAQPAVKRRFIDGFKASVASFSAGLRNGLVEQLKGWFRLDGEDLVPQ